MPQRPYVIDEMISAKAIAARVEALAKDLEFAYQELAEFLGVEPSERPAIYLYADLASKKRLMGAGRTELAMSLFGRSYGKHLGGVAEKDGVAIDISSVPKANFG